MIGPELSIIIVNWNGINFLPNCLKSILQYQPSLPFEIVVVDNDSSDGSAEWLRSAECKQIMQSLSFSVLEPRENLGFGRANNLAIEATMSPNVFILNPDTLVTAGALDKLVDTLRSEPTIGMVGPRLHNEDGTLQDSVSRHPPTPGSIIVEGLQLYRILPTRLTAPWLLGTHWDHNERRSVPVIAGAAMMCKREMINAIGGFDPSIHMYAEDIELCVRARRLGWNIFFEPTASIMHSRNRSAEQRWTTDEQAIVQEKAMLYYENKTFSRPLNLSNGIARVIVSSMHVLRKKLQGRNTTLMRQLLRMHIENCKHLLFGPREGAETISGT